MANGQLNIENREWVTKSLVFWQERKMEMVDGKYCMPGYSVAKTRKLIQWNIDMLTSALARIAADEAIDSLISA